MAAGYTLQIVPLPGDPPGPPAYGDTGAVTALTVVGTVALVGIMFGLGALYNRWAYDDWTCMFKNCVQTSVKRSRRR